jgi:hypothetical protein
MVPINCPGQLTWGRRAALNRLIERQEVTPAATEKLMRISGKGKQTFYTSAGCELIGGSALITMWIFFRLVAHQIRMTLLPYLEARLTSAWLPCSCGLSQVKSTFVLIPRRNWLY